MPDLVIATLLWDANGKEYDFSSMYDESWVEKLYRGCKRHCTVPFEFICFTEKVRDFDEPITQCLLSNPEPSYGDCIEPYKLGRPMILMGLDTIITGNIDHLARYCLEDHWLAVPRDPFDVKTVCNGVALVPASHQWVWDEWDGENDMDWIRGMRRRRVIDDLYPGHVVSYKGHVMHEGLDDARIVYFHGKQKPHELDHDWIQREWL